MRANTNRTTLLVTLGAFLLAGAGCGRAEDDTVTSQSQLESSAVELRASNVAYDIEDPDRVFGLCDLAANANSIVVGDVLAVDHTGAHGSGCNPDDYWIAAPGKRVTLATDDGEQSLIFLEKHTSHDIRVGDRLIVGVRAAGAFTFGLGYLLVDPPDGRGRTEVAIDPGIPRALDHLPTAAVQAIAHCPRLVDSEFDRYALVPARGSLLCP